jgi:molybdopterin-guanine dinucleotide biosynthesis protein
MSSDVTIHIKGRKASGRYTLSQVIIPALEERGLTVR